MEQAQVLYADDIICMTQSEAATNRLLRAIEDEGRQYGLKLNKANANNYTPEKQDQYDSVMALRSLSNQMQNVSEVI